MRLKPKVTFNSLNVRGLNNEKKRQTIFQWLQSSHQGITLLQETHSLERDENLWTKDWGNKIIFSHGTRHSSGVAILLDKKYDYNISEVKKDTNGRFLLVNIEINNENFILINVYAPTKDNCKEQKQFFEYVNDKLEDYTGCNIIIGGDFNVCLNPNLDKQGGAKVKQSARAKQIYEIAETNDLIDVWRTFNEDKRRFTWRSFTKNGRVSSRLDFWLISSHLMFDVENTLIEPSIKTDHSLIKINLNLKKTPERGRGFWKINNSLLMDKDYIKLINSLLEDCSAKFQNIQNKALVWDCIKCEIRGATIQFAVQKAKEKRQYETNLRAELKVLEDKLDNNEEVMDTYNTVKKDLEQIEEEKLRGNIVRSRAQLIEEGEKCSKYFMNLENRNYRTKCITTLLKDEIKISKQPDILDECRRFYEHLYSKSMECNLFEKCQFFNTNHIELNEIEKEICETKLCLEECYESLLKLSNNKTPGCDGISVEFYKVFWDKIKQFIIESYDYSFENSILSLDQRRALLMLIPKGNKDKRLLKNWRLISLLNVDYKIMAKALAIRLQKVISSVINSDQVGYIKGRYIGDNIRTMLVWCKLHKKQHVSAFFGKSVLKCHLT